MDTKKKSLTKTQINYFADKLRVITRRVVEQVEEQCKLRFPKQMTNKEKIELVASGRAELKYDKLMNSAIQGWGLGNFIDAFDFPGDCDKNVAFKGAELALTTYLNNIRKDSASLLDDFVLGRFEDIDIVVKEFEDRVDGYVKDFLENHLK